MPVSPKKNIEEELSKAEKELEKCKAKVSKLRREFAAQKMDDYTFYDPDGKKIPLSSLFGDKEDLILIHNMGKECRYCTLWADGFNGVYWHLENRAGFVVASPNDPATVKTFSQGRGWKFKMISMHETSFNKDMGFESEKGKPMPGVSTFHRDTDGKISRIGAAYFGPGDEFCAVWHILDLLKDGPNGWEPKYSY